MFPADDDRRPAPGGGSVSYRMARRAVLESLRRGTVGRTEVCDAHPELIRAALHQGTPIDEPCPLCDARMVHVSYVFGPRLPSHGRCISSSAELDKIRHRKGDFTRYVVEVCPTCRWHHLDSAEVL
ncbi:MAG: DUF5318 family protein [Actinomycetota bacterium]